MNLLHEIIHFLIPGMDVLQLFFFILMTLSIALTIISVTFFAKVNRWQSYWDKHELGDASDGVSIELGSAAELSQSVATKAEKIAAIMPGMLLILGLLGTFLGLGLALDKASGILHSAGNSIGDMDSSMRDLMDMMQGLGIKFKTSTWGIISFITLKVWESTNGYEERRLNWCLTRMRQAIRERVQYVNAEQEALIQQQQQDRHLNTSYIVDALEKQSVVLKAEYVTQAQRAEEYEAKRHEYQLAALNEIAKINGQSRALLETYTLSSQENLRALQQAATTMSDASQKVAYSAEGLQSVVTILGQDLGVVMGDIKHELSKVVSDMNSDFTHNVQQMSEILSASTSQLSLTMQKIETSLGEAIDNMAQAFNHNMVDMSTQLSSATTKISQSVDNMSLHIAQTMAVVSEKTEDSAKIQRRAMGEFSETSETLNVQVSSMTQYIERVTKEIQSGLAAVSENNRRMDHCIKRFNDGFDALSKIPDSLSGMTIRIGTLCDLLFDHAEYQKEILSFLPLIQREELDGNKVCVNDKKQNYRSSSIPDTLFEV